MAGKLQPVQLVNPYISKVPKLSGNSQAFDCVDSVDMLANRRVVVLFRVADVARGKQARVLTGRRQRLGERRRMVEEL